MPRPCPHCGSNVSDDARKPENLRTGLNVLLGGFVGYLFDICARSSWRRCRSCGTVFHRASERRRRAEFGLLVSLAILLLCGVLIAVTAGP